jgi:hypothetical protein
MHDGLLITDNNARPRIRIDRDAIGPNSTAENGLS